MDAFSHREDPAVGGSILCRRPIARFGTSTQIAEGVGESAIDSIANMATGPRLFHVRIGPDGSAESAPMTASAVKALVAKGLPANAVIREAGTARWHLISTVKGLAAAPIETAPAFDWRTTPLVRVSSSYANFVSHRIDDVIGVFPDGVMTFRKQRHVPLPQEIGVSVGTSQLGDVRTLGARRTAT